MKKLYIAILIWFFPHHLISSNIYKHQIVQTEVNELNKMGESLGISDLTGWPVSNAVQVDYLNVNGISFKPVDTIFVESVDNDDIYVIKYKVRNIFLDSSFNKPLPGLSFPELESLSMIRCNITGSIPELDLPSCKKIQLQYNEISDSIPPDLNLPQVEEFRLNDNNLTGELPQFTKMDNLQILLLSSNSLTSIDENFSMPELRTLYLYNNAFLGELPKLNCPNLEELDLGHFNFTGGIPQMNLPSCKSISLYGNQLSGTLPELNYPSLTYFNVAENQLTGQVPTFSGMPNLSFLNLDGNKFTSLPQQWYHSTLEYMHIDGCELIGNIPEINMPELARFELAGNQLSGNMPSLDNCTRIVGIHLENNQLSGQIPDLNLPELDVMILTNNQLSGELPNLNCPLLRNLDISNNKLTGEISSLNLPNLSYLTLDKNEFTGKIDNSNLSKMTILSISENGIEELPHLKSSSPDLNYVHVNKCKLDFGDLEPNMDIDYIEYADQDSVYHYKLTEKNLVKLYLKVEGEQNNYQWKTSPKNSNSWSNLTDGNEDTLRITPAKDSLNKYFCTITNSLVPNLSLYSKLSKGPPCLTLGYFELCSETGYWEPIEKEEHKVQSTGKVTINDLLNFEGAITIDTVNLTVKAEGEFYISDIPVPGGNIGKYTFSKGEYELKLLGEDGKITEFLNSKLDSVGEVCGIDLKLSSLQLVGGRNASGIKMDCKIGIPGIAGSCGESDETKSEIELNGLEFSTSGVSLEGVKITDLGLIVDGYCLKELAISYDSEKDIFTSGAKVNLPFGEIGGGIKMEKGSLDSIAWHLEATKPPFVLGTTTIGIKGFYGHISNIVKPPYEIELGGIFTDVVVDNLYLLDVKGRTVWPTVFEVEGNGKFMKPPLSEKPYQINGGIKMTYDHPMQMFALGITGKIGTSDEETWLIDGKGELKLYTKFSPPKLVGSMEGKMTLQKFDDEFPYNWLNSMFSFPIEASTNCKMWWAQDRGIIGNATFQTETAGPYGLHYIFDLNKSYDQEGFLYWDATIEQKSAKIKSGSVIAESIENVSIPENSDFAVIGVISVTQSPSSSLKNPDGKIYDNTNAEDNILYSVSTDTKEGFWTIKNPMEGNWEIIVQNPEESDSILVFIQEKLAKLDVSFTQNGNNVNVTWNKETFSEESVIVLLLDEDTTGFDGITVAQGNANNGQLNFAVSDSLNECNYHLCAMVLDGIRLSSAYANGMININKSFLTAPIITEATYNSNSDRIIVNYQNSSDMNTFGYIVDINDEADINSAQTILMAGENSFELDIKNFESKKIKMTSFDVNGLKGCPSEEMSIIAGTNIIEKEQRKNNLIFYPNPTAGKGTITFKIDQETICKITITDIYGRQIAQLINEKRVAGMYNEDWDFDDLPNGLYLIILQTDNNLSSVKCILNR